MRESQVTELSQMVPLSCSARRPMLNPRSKNRSTPIKLAVRELISAERIPPCDVRRLEDIEANPRALIGASAKTFEEPHGHEGSRLRDHRRTRPGDALRTELNASKASCMVRSFPAATNIKAQMLAAPLALSFMTHTTITTESPELNSTTNLRTVAEEHARLEPIQKTPTKSFRERSVSSGASSRTLARPNWSRSV